MDYNISVLNGMAVVNGLNISGFLKGSTVIDSGGSDSVYDGEYGAYNGSEVDMCSGDYGEYYNYDDNCTYSGYSNASQEYDSILDTHYLFNIFPFEVIVLGGLYPALTIITALANALVIGVFMSRRSRGKATNLLFVSIAISDTLTGLVLLPNSFYIYAYNRRLLTAGWCRFSMIMRFYVSRVFHTASVWQTVLLGVQRFLCVCHPFASSRICTISKTFCAIVFIYVCSMTLHVFHLTNEKIWNRECIWHIEDPCEESCVYMWFCAVFQHLLPVFVLVYLTCRTILSLKKASRRVSVSSRTSAMKRHSRDRLISITATSIVIVFLVPELPHGLFKLTLLVLMHLGDQHVDLKVNHTIFAVYEICLVISFHLNFWIYCVMMRDFRQRIFAFLTFGYFRKRQDRERHMSTGSSSSRQGTLRQTLSRTSSDANARNRILSSSSSQQAMLRSMLSRTNSDGSAINRLLSNNASVPSRAPCINGTSATTTPQGDKATTTPQGDSATTRPQEDSDNPKLVFDASLSIHEADTCIPMALQSSVTGDDIKDPYSKCATQISQESAYLSGDANEDDVFL